MATPPQVNPTANFSLPHYHLRLDSTTESKTNLKTVPTTIKHSITEPTKTKPTSPTLPTPKLPPQPTTPNKHVSFNLNKNTSTSNFTTSPTTPIPTNANPPPSILRLNLTPRKRPLETTVYNNDSHSENRRALTLANQRNEVRVNLEQDRNRAIVGKSKQTSKTFLTISSLLPEPIIQKEHNYITDQEAINKIKTILSTPLASLQEPPFDFTCSNAAATSNLKIITKYNYNLQECINGSNSICSPGSEFRPADTLKPLLQYHPLWEAVQNAITNGVTMHLKHEPIEAQRILENNEMIIRQNHHSAKLNPEVIAKSLLQELERGYAFVIPVDCVSQIPSSMICPLGIIDQTTLSPDGSRKTKKRLTHDQTFCALEKSESLNKLTDLTKYPDLIYGFCLPRIILHITSLRHHYPNKRILISKFDIAKAYRRLHYHGASAYKCIAIFGELAYIQLRLSFGGAACPQAWCCISEIITDLANSLTQNRAWKLNDLQSPDQHHIAPAEYLNEMIPFAETLPTMLLPPPRPEGFSDVFVDDIITTFLDDPANIDRSPAAVPLATHIITRPLSPNEHVTREQFLAKDKLAAEGNPTESKIILGWTINTRSLLISLPNDKHIAWSSDITDIMTSTTCTRKELEQLIGRLNHASLIIPMARFFLGSLRHRFAKARHKGSVINFNKSEIKILNLWIQLLLVANKGINFNLINLRRPTNVIITDACPAGLGGYSVRTGKAWRIDITNTSTTNNNSLEFLASVIGILAEWRDQAIPNHGNILALTDNSSCACWLYKNSFASSTHPTNTEIATTLAHSCISNHYTVHPQHIKGSSNNIADSLSRLHKLNDHELTQFLTSSFPEQIPENFKISPLPPELISWVFSTLALAQSSLIPGQKQLTKKLTAVGEDGTNTSPSSTCNMILTSTTSPRQQKSTYVEGSSNASETAPSPNPKTKATKFVQTIKNNYSAGVSARPLASWLRNSGMLSETAQYMTMTVPTSSPQQLTDSSKPGKILTPKSNKKVQ